MWICCYIAFFFFSLKTKENLEIVWKSQFKIIDFVLASGSSRIVEITASPPNTCKQEPIVVIHLQEQIVCLCRSKLSVTQLMLRSSYPHSNQFRVGLIQPAPNPGHFTPMSSYNLSSGFFPLEINTFFVLEDCSTMWSKAEYGKTIRFVSEVHCFKLKQPLIATASFQWMFPRTRSLSYVWNSHVMTFCLLFFMQNFQVLKSNSSHFIHTTTSGMKALCLISRQSRCARSQAGLGGR